MLSRRYCGRGTPEHHNRGADGDAKLDGERTAPTFGSDGEGGGTGGGVARTPGVTGRKDGRSSDGTAAWPNQKETADTERYERARPNEQRMEGIVAVVVLPSEIDMALYNVALFFLPFFLLEFFPACAHVVVFLKTPKIWGVPTCAPRFFRLCPVLRFKVA